MSNIMELDLIPLNKNTEFYIYIDSKFLALPVEFYKEKDQLYMKTNVNFSKSDLIHGSIKIQDQKDDLIYTLNLNLELIKKSAQISLYRIKSHELIKDENQNDPNQIQEFIPNAEEYLQNYNKNLFRRVLKENTKCKIISSFNNIISLSNLYYNYDETKGRLYGSFASNDIILEKIKLNPFVKLAFYDTTLDTDVILESFCKVIQSNVISKQVNIDLKNKDNIILEIIPINLKYGDQTELETLYFGNFGKQYLKRIFITLSSKLKFYTKVIRPYFILSSILSILLGTADAFQKGYAISVSKLILAIIGLFLILLGASLINEFYDYETKKDLPSRFFPSFSPFRSDLHIIQSELSDTNFLISNGVIFAFIGGLIGLYLDIVSKGNIILYIGIIGMFLALSYSSSPLKLSYRALGEIVIILCFGPLPYIGAYYLQSNSFNLQFNDLLLALPIGIFLSQISTLHDLRNRIANERANKLSIANILGAKNVNYLIFGEFVFSYAVIIYLAITHTLSLISLIVFVSLIFIIRLKSIKAWDAQKISEFSRNMNLLYFHLIIFAIIITITLLF